MFYKYEDFLMYGPIVSFADGSILVLDAKDTYTYPVDGWYYFDTEEEAKIFFNIVD
jgi:hypothetical protein